jgi:ribosomal protein L14E/L6E/L27E
MKIPIEVGRVVRSKAGRDQGRMFVVIDMGADFAQVVDGRLRTMDRPKTKRLKHLEATKEKVDVASSKTIRLVDHDIRQALKVVQAKEEG